MTDRPAIDVRADIEPGDTLTKPKTDQDNRQTGRTTQQIKNAPFGAVFVWANSDIKYPKALASKLGRDDLEVRPRSWLKPNSVRGRRFSGVVVDHAALFCSEAYAALSLLRARACLLTDDLLDQIDDYDKQIRLDEGSVQRGGACQGPKTPKPEITPKGQGPTIVISEPYETIVPEELLPRMQISAASDKEFFLKLKQYIEYAEHKIDGEWGHCRSVEQLISDGEMPDLYFQVLQRITSVAPHQETP